AAGALFDGAFDVVARHARHAAFEQNHAQARVQARVATADFGGNGDFARQLGKNPRALGVYRALEKLDLRPFAVTSHKVIYYLRLMIDAQMPDSRLNRKYFRLPPQKPPCHSTAPR